MRISDWSSDVCSSDLAQHGHRDEERQEAKTHTISPIAAILLRPAAQRIACRVRISSLSAPESLRLASRAIRSEERRVGKECVSTCKSRWSEYTIKKTITD